MRIASGMKELTRNIASSRKERMKRVGGIRKEANEARGDAKDMVASFGDSRRETNRHLRQDLAKDKARRKSEATGIVKEARNTLKSFEASRKAKSTRFRTELSGGTEERRVEVAKTLEDARKLIGGFGISRRNVSSGLRKDLGRSVAKTKAEAGKLQRNARSLVKGFQTSRREAGGQLRKGRAQSRADMESGVKQMLGDFNKTRGSVRADLKEARASWQGLASAGQAAKDKIEAPPKVKEEKASDLKTKLSPMVNEHPERIKAVGVAKSLSVAHHRGRKGVKNHSGNGKVRKEDKVYSNAAIK